jgi:hypothetical protein
MNFTIGAPLLAASVQSDQKRNFVVLFWLFFGLWERFASSESFDPEFFSPVLPSFIAAGSHSHKVI